MKKISFLFVLLLVTAVSLSGVDAFSHNSTDLPQNESYMLTQQAESPLSGKVVETMNSGGYTYVSIEKNGKISWIAVPEMTIEVGQDVSFNPGMVMNNFTSKTLNRTFETIVFSSGVAGQSGTGSVKKATVKKQPNAAAIKVEKAAGPDAYTVAELHEKRIELHEKGVVIRGKVVKFSPQIMGKNWIHIQDGSGDSSDGTNDILVTTQDVLSVDDIVTVNGTLYKDKDFGGRYKYDVIVEDASVKKQ